MIYIIRHGQTQENHNRELLGRRDVPLNAEGRRQAEQVRQYFEDNGIRINCVYSSPLVRALQTAEIITGMKPEQNAAYSMDLKENNNVSGSEKADLVGNICTDDRLIEMDYGPFEGAKLENMPRELLDFFDDFVHNPAPDGMEQLADVVHRAGDFIEDVGRRWENRGGNLLISTHAIAMKGILEYLTPDSHGSYWSKYLGNCSVYRTELRDGRFTVPEKVL